MRISDDPFVGASGDGAAVHVVSRNAAGVDPDPQVFRVVDGFGEQDVFKDVLYVFRTHTGIVNIRVDVGPVDAVGNDTFVFSRDTAD